MECNFFRHSFFSLIARGQSGQTGGLSSMSDDSYTEAAAIQYGELRQTVCCWAWSLPVQNNHWISIVTAPPLRPQRPAQPTLRREERGETATTARRSEVTTQRLNGRGKEKTRGWQGKRASQNTLKWMKLSTSQWVSFLRLSSQTFQTFFFRWVQWQTRFTPVPGNVRKTGRKNNPSSQCRIEFEFKMNLFSADLFLKHYTESDWVVGQDDLVSGTTGFIWYFIFSHEECLTIKLNFYRKNGVKVVDNEERTR